MKRYICLQPQDTQRQPAATLLLSRVHHKKIVNIRSFLVILSLPTILHGKVLQNTFPSYHGIWEMFSKILIFWNFKTGQVHQFSEHHPKDHNLAYFWGYKIKNKCFCQSITKEPPSREDVGVGFQNPPMKGKNILFFLLKNLINIFFYQEINLVFFFFFLLLFLFFFF